MFEALNYFVEKLIRIKIGPIDLGALAVGELRPLYQSEVMALKVAVGLARPGRADAERRPVITAKKKRRLHQPPLHLLEQTASSGARNESS